MRGNTRLVEYGIQNEKSDVRIHVCVKVRRLYVYDTQAGQQAIMKGAFRKVPVRTKNITTAIGYLVPPKSIPGCHQVIVADNVWKMSRIATYPERGHQSEKGRAAVYIVQEALKQGLIPLNVTAKEIADKDMQIAGTDIYVKAGIKIQVKCDYNGGPKAYGGTGNLFLQIAECNPFKLY